MRKEVANQDVQSTEGIDIIIILSLDVSPHTLSLLYCFSYYNGSVKSFTLQEIFQGR